MVLGPKAIQVVFFGGKVVFFPSKILFFGFVVFFLDYQRLV